MAQAQDWQQNRTVLQANDYMLDNQIACDVNFLVGHKAEKIGAHKYMLVSRSPVFFAMFCGEFKEVSDTVRVPDVDPDTFRDLLQYIYCEKVNLTPDTIPIQLYASEKYMLKGLSAVLWDWMSQNINDETACAVLESSVRYNNSEMETRMKAYIMEHATGVLRSSTFTVLSQDTLRDLLAKDDFFANEEDIYMACLAWGRRRCREAEEEADGAAIRRALGDCLQLIRFPTMDGGRFVKLMDSCPEVLTTDEQFSLTKFFLTRESKEPHGFRVQPRLCRFKVERLTTVLLDLDSIKVKRWLCSDGRPDAICFTCDKEVFLIGLSFTGSECASTHKVEVEVQDSAGDSLFKQRVEMLDFPKETLGVDFLFDERVPLSPGTKYTVLQRLWGSEVYCGSGGRDTVKAEGITFQFSKSPVDKNGTGVESGQIQALIFQRHQ